MVFVFSVCLAGDPIVQVQALVADCFALARLYEQCVHKRHPFVPEEAGVLRGQLRHICADTAGAAGEPGKALQLGAGADQTHEGE